MDACATSLKFVFSNFVCKFAAASSTLARVFPTNRRAMLTVNVFVSVNSGITAFVCLENVACTRIHVQKRTKVLGVKENRGTNIIYFIFLFLLVRTSRCVTEKEN